MSAVPAAAAAVKPKQKPFPTLLNGYTLDWVLLVLAVLFYSQHPNLRESSPTTLLQHASTYVANTTAALQVSSTRQALLSDWYGYFLDSDLGSAKNNADPMLRGFYELNEWKNSLLLPLSVREKLPHVVAIWLRNYVAIHLVYFGVGFLWAAYIYWFAVDKFFPKDAKTGKREMPSWESIRAQMWVSWKAMPMYVLMPTATEWLVERGLSRAVDTFEKLGGIQGWLVWTCVLLFFVEWGIYWVHRYLHDNRTLYKWLHYDHHIYCNNADLSPFAGLAFHPIDGMLQASPYVVFMCAIPCHFWTVEILLFFTGIWTASIHDTLMGDTEPIMGSKYHTYHHTAYVDNYGQFFVFFDWIHNTLTDPILKKKGE